MLGTRQLPPEGEAHSEKQPVSQAQDGSFQSRTRRLDEGWACVGTGWLLVREPGCPGLHLPVPDTALPHRRGAGSACGLRPGGVVLGMAVKSRVRV